MPRPVTTTHSPHSTMHGAGRSVEGRRPESTEEAAGSIRTHEWRCRTERVVDAMDASVSAWCWLGGLLVRLEDESSRRREAALAGPVIRRSQLVGAAQCTIASHPSGEEQTRQRASYCAHRVEAFQPVWASVHSCTLAFSVACWSDHALRLCHAMQIQPPLSPWLIHARRVRTGPRATGRIQRISRSSDTRQTISRLQLQQPRQLHQRQLQRLLPPSEQMYHR
jgi:hypothetical protein